MGNLAISFWVGRRIYSMEKKECNTFWGLSITSLTKQVRWSMLQLAVEVDSDRQTDTHTHTHTHKHPQTHTHTIIFHICSIFVVVTATMNSCLLLIGVDKESKNLITSPAVYITVEFITLWPQEALTAFLCTCFGKFIHLGWKVK